MIYLDTSAAIKALVVESGSDDVRRLFEVSEPLVSSRLMRVELHAAAERRSVSRVGVDELLASVALVSVDDDVLDRAVTLRTGLRSLDAIHLATAIALEGVVTAFLAFDAELNRVKSRRVVSFRLFPVVGDG